MKCVVQSPFGSSVSRHVTNIRAGGNPWKVDEGCGKLINSHGSTSGSTDDEWKEVTGRVRRSKKSNKGNYKNKKGNSSVRKGGYRFKTRAESDKTVKKRVCEAKREVGALKSRQPTLHPAVYGARVASVRQDNASTRIKTKETFKQAYKNRRNSAVSMSNNKKSPRSYGGKPRSYRGTNRGQVRSETTKSEFTDDQKKLFEAVLLEHLLKLRAEEYSNGKGGSRNLVKKTVKKNCGKKKVSPEGEANHNEKLLAKIGQVHEEILSVAELISPSSSDQDAKNPYLHSREQMDDYFTASEEKKRTVLISLCKRLKDVAKIGLPKDFSYANWLKQVKDCERSVPRRSADEVHDGPDNSRNQARRVLKEKLIRSKNARSKVYLHDGNTYYQATERGISFNDARLLPIHYCYAVDTELPQDKDGNNINDSIAISPNPSERDSRKRDPSPSRSSQDVKAEEAKPVEEGSKNPDNEDEDDGSDSDFRTAASATEDAVPEDVSVEQPEAGGKDNEGSVPVTEETPFTDRDYRYMVGTYLSLFLNGTINIDDMDSSAVKVFWDALNAETRFAISEAYEGIRKLVPGENQLEFLRTKEATGDEVKGVSFADRLRTPTIRNATRIPLIIKECASAHIQDSGESSLDPESSPSSSAPPVTRDQPVAKQETDGNINASNARTRSESAKKLANGHHGIDESRKIHNGIDDGDSQGRDDFNSSSDEEYGDEEASGQHEVEADTSKKASKLFMYLAKAARNMRLSRLQFSQDPSVRAKLFKKWCEELSIVLGTQKETMGMLDSATYEVKSEGLEEYVRIAVAHLVYAHIDKEDTASRLDREHKMKEGPKAIQRLRDVYAPKCTQEEVKIQTQIASSRLLHHESATNFLMKMRKLYELAEAQGVTFQDLARMKYTLTSMAHTQNALYAQAVH